MNALCSCLLVNTRCIQCRVKSRIAGSWGMSIISLGELLKIIQALFKIRKHPKYRKLWAVVWNTHESITEKRQMLTFRPISFICLFHIFEIYKLPNIAKTPSQPPSLFHIFPPLRGTFQTYTMYVWIHKPYTSLFWMFLNFTKVVASCTYLFLTFIHSALFVCNNKAVEIS